MHFNSIEIYDYWISLEIIITCIQLPIMNHEECDTRFQKGVMMQELQEPKVNLLVYLNNHKGPRPSQLCLLSS